jgi:insulysin
MSQGNRKETSSATCAGKGQEPSSRVEGQLTLKEEVKIALPPNDDRGHRYLRLNNGLECVLVSDATCDKAAAAMDVGVGASEDPENLQGCAHFW